MRGKYHQRCQKKCPKMVSKWCPKWCQSRKFKMVSEQKIEQKILFTPFLAFIVLEAKFFLKKLSDDKMLLKNTKVWYNYF